MPLSTWVIARIAGLMLSLNSMVDLGLDSAWWKEIESASEDAWPFAPMHASVSMPEPIETIGSRPDRFHSLAGFMDDAALKSTRLSSTNCVALFAKTPRPGSIILVQDTSDARTYRVLLVLRYPQDGGVQCLPFCRYETPQQFHWPVRADGTEGPKSRANTTLRISLNHGWSLEPGVSINVAVPRYLELDTHVRVLGQVHDRSWNEVLKENAQLHWESYLSLRWPVPVAQEAAADTPPSPSTTPPDSNRSIQGSTYKEKHIKRSRPLPPSRPYQVRKHRKWVFARA